MATNTDKNPQNGVQGSSYLYHFGTTPNTRTAVSQRNRVLAPAYGETAALHQMGVLSQFNVSGSRTIDSVRGIGFGDQIAELVPSVTEQTKLNFERAMLYLCNLWQATGYAGGVDGPVRSLAHHRWPFDIEQQLVFSSLVDADFGRANQGVSGTSGSFDGGLKAIQYPAVTKDTKGFPNDPPKRGHSAIITVYEACWFTSYTNNYAKDSGVVMETGDADVTDVHDFSSIYGEFLATGNDPTIGQLGSIRFADVATTEASSAATFTIG